MATSSEFGAFFREIREGLGLSLREFCRRTGFDQANVSRLERGLLPPPKSKRVLTAYAKGLRLKPESAEWERFMTLAKPPAKPRRGQGHRNWVRAKNLEDWAGTLDARDTLPQLVRRLIRATGEGLTRPLEAPAGEQTQRPGWDVLVEASGNAEFVPQGVSAWEMGVDRDPKGKAEADFAKRQKKSPGVTKRKSTFIFVTPRKWQKKSEWVEKKAKLKSWKEVRVYDSASLEEWLECAPAVDFWLARQLGLCPPGLIDVDEHWKNLRARTDPSLEAAVYLASREKQVGELREWLEGPPDTLVIESRSPDEAVDFIVAVSRPELGGAFAGRIAARTLIVETRDAWRSLAVGDARLVLVVHPALAIEAELVAEAVRNGHHVIVCASGPLVSECRQIELPRVSRLDLRKALEAQGVEREWATDLATAAGGSIAVLKRLTARHPGTVHPEWSTSPHARRVVPLLLAGRWSDASEGDRLALGNLADAPYRAVAELAEQWATPPDPMLTRAPSRWELVSRDDSWTLLSEALNKDDLRRFEQVALEVLGELDPACDLPINERRQASILGNVRAHSRTLRSGLAETLALLGARPPKPKGLPLDSKGLARRIVWTLLHDKDWKMWASLSSELPLLAEAAPDAFLSALEKDLSKASPAVVKLFDLDSPPLFGSDLHTGLLFGLEGLAWDRNSLSRLSHLLARLCEVASTMEHGNNPMRTLDQIFMPWKPQTTAPVEERVKILESISRRHPKAGWRLLLQLLPTPRSTVSPNYRPAFQNWALQWSKEVTRAEAAFQVEACAHLVVELVEKDAGRLKDAIEVFENLPPSAQTKLLEHMSMIAPPQLKTDDRRTLAQVIREKVNRHQRFADTDWALQEPVLEKLDRIRKRLEPSDGVARNAWLFSDYWKVQELAKRLNPEGDAADEVVEHLRATALDEVRSDQGWDGVLALAEAAASPDQVGLAVGARAIEGDDTRVLPKLLTDKRRGLAEMAKGYVGMKQRQQGWTWVEKLPLDRWSDDELVEFMLALRPESKAWGIVAKRGQNAEEQYWKKVQPFRSSKNVADVSRACTMLTKAGRPLVAVRQLAMALNRGVKPDPAVIVHVLESGRGALLSKWEQQEALGQVEYDVKVLIQKLQYLVEAGDARVDVNAVADLEWVYLFLLDGYPTVPKTLYTWLEKRPQFFVELLTILFPQSDEQSGKRPEPSERERAQALQIYRLLNSWQQVPGSQPDGSVDAEALRAWVNSVQTTAGNEVRHEVAFRIGNVFAHAPLEPDGTWPCIPVRDAIEEYGSEELAEGFEIGTLNKRPAYNKAVDEGGVQEQLIANDYFEWAEASRIEWPKTAASLRRVGEAYEVYARREDAEAESR
jgi:transcriptional regulator with XRE-family HTH domain